MNFGENLDNVAKADKLEILSRILGVQQTFDPDATYELTTDNVKKLLAIYMRLKCNIPVIVMGETGCGKTRMVQYLCALMLPPKARALKLSNLVMVKIHGGHREEQIIDILQQAIKKADVYSKWILDNQPKDTQNQEKSKSVPFTVLFLDETNSSEAIHVIKHLLCNQRIKSVQLPNNLKLVCACNPYRFSVYFSM